MTENLSELTEAIERITEDEDNPIDLTYQAELYAAYAWNLGLDPEKIEDWKDEAEEAYQGDYATDEEFAQQLADDLGAITSDQPWPNSHIDWEAAARDLMMDYFEVSGYYFRNL